MTAVPDARLRPTEPHRAGRSPAAARPTWAQNAPHGNREAVSTRRIASSDRITPGGIIRTQPTMPDSTAEIVMGTVFRPTRCPTTVEPGWPVATDAQPDPATKRMGRCRENPPVAVKTRRFSNHTMLLTFLIRTLDLGGRACEGSAAREGGGRAPFRITKPFRFYRGSPNVPSSGPPATRRRASGARSDERRARPAAFIRCTRAYRDRPAHSEPARNARRARTQPAAFGVALSARRAPQRASARGRNTRPSAASRADLANRA